jgi:hypothetical protein
MDAVTATARMTAAEFLALPWEETRWSELIDVSLDVGPGETLTSPQLPGLALAVARIFELG